MNRRYVVRYIAGTFVPIAGCGGDYTGDGTPEPRWGLTIIPRIQFVDEGWRSRITLENEFSPHTTFHAVTIHLYSRDGSLITEEHVGDVDGVAEVELSTDTFPHLITTIAAESPCDERVDIGITYWNGTTDERSQTADSVSDSWKFDSRRCGESLPPERLLNESDTSGTDQ